MCGKSNPEELEECQYCGARLKPLLASSPPEESRPPTPPGSPEPVEPTGLAAQEEERDDWLDDLRDEGAVGTDELSLTGELDPTRLEGPPPREPSPELDEAGTPEWLQRLRSKRGSQSETPELEIDQPPDAAEPPPPAAQDETPTWLEHFRDQEEEVEAPPEEPAPPTPRASGSLRERLAAVERGEGPPEPPAPAEPPAPDMGEFPPEALETLPGLGARLTEGLPEDSDLPDWLAGPEPEEELEPEPETEPTIGIPPEALETREVPGLSFREQDTQPEEDGLPDWLQELGPETAEPSEPAMEEPQVEVPSEALETKDIPGLEFQAGDEAAEPADLPEWLQDLAPVDEAPVEPAPETLPEQPVQPETPSWVPEPAEETYEPLSEALETKDIPGLGFQDQEAAPAEDMPEWLQGLGTEVPPESPEPPPAAPEPLTPGQLPEPAAEAEEPEPAAWPPEPESEEILEEALETREIPGLSFRDEDEPELEAAGDLPDWLQDVQSEAPEPSLPDEGPADLPVSEDFPVDIEESDEEEATPEWLLGLEAEAAEAEAAAEAIAPPPAPEQSVIAEEPEEEQHEDILPELDVGPPEGEVPEWLAAAAAEVPSSGPLKLPEEEEVVEPAVLADEPEVAEPAEALPDWLQDAGPPPEGEEVPDLDAIPEPEPVVPELDAELLALEDEIPQWMVDEGLDVEEPPLPEVIPELDETVAEMPVLEDAEPEWLQASEVDQEPPVSLERGDLPDWLQGLQAAQEEAIPEAESLQKPESPIEPETAEPAEAVPPWLAELRAKTAEAPTIGEIEEDPEELADIPLQVGIEPQMEGVEPAELPDWISEMSPERAGQIEIEAEPEAEEEVAPAEAGEDLAPAELPGWLKAMRPVEAVTPLAPSEEAARGVEGVGPLAGLQGILPAEPEITQAGRPPSFSMRVEVTQNQYEHVEKLKTLLEEEAESQAVGPRWGVVQPQHVLRWIILAVMLLAVGIPMAFGFQQNDLPTLVPEETVEVGSLVLGLPLNARVLVSYDYQPGLSAEMDAVSEAVLDHMIRLRQVHLVMVSTNTSGPALAERFLADPLGAGQHGFVHGEHYINLGYIPGGAAGLIDFVTSPRRVLPIPFNLDAVPDSGVWTNSLLADIGTAADFDMVVVIVDDANTARSWVEQVGPRLDGVPLVMVSSAQAAPMILPYYQTEPRQVDGMIAGLPGAVSYLRINDQARLARPYWDAFGNGLLIAALLIVVGGFISGSANILQRTQPVSIEELE
jgi:hypothetical protein